MEYLSEEIMMGGHLLKTCSKKLLSGGVLSVLAVLASPSYADYSGSFSVTGTVTGQPGGNPLAGTATFSINSVTDLLTITLTNDITIAQLAASAQFLSQIGFSILGGIVTVPNDTNVNPQTPYNLVT